MFHRNIMLIFISAKKISQRRNDPEKNFNDTAHCELRVSARNYLSDDAL